MRGSLCLSSIFLLRPQNENAIACVDENTGQNSSFQPYWPTVVVEHRFIGPIAEGINADGLAIGWNSTYRRSCSLSSGQNVQVSDEQL
jgi:hypothetical protein